MLIRWTLLLTTAMVWLAAGQHQGQAVHKDYYSILGLDAGAGSTDKDIKSAYRKLAMKYHPDKVSRGQELFESRSCGCVDIEATCTSRTRRIRRRPRRSSRRSLRPTVRR
jgi:hypothetical protein